MTLDETMIINNMTNVIKNLEQSKRICDIIDDLNELILTLGRNHDMKHVPEPVKAQPAQPAQPASPPSDWPVVRVEISTKTNKGAGDWPAVRVKTSPKKNKGAGAGQWEG